MWAYLNINSSLLNQVLHNTTIGPIDTIFDLILQRPTPQLRNTIRPLAHISPGTVALIALVPAYFAI